MSSYQPLCTPLVALRLWFPIQISVIKPHLIFGGLTYAYKTYKSLAFIMFSMLLASDDGNLTDVEMPGGIPQMESLPLFASNHTSAEMTSLSSHEQPTEDTKTGSTRKYDDDVQFISEKPVKKGTPAWVPLTEKPPLPSYSRDVDLNFLGSNGRDTMVVDMKPSMGLTGIPGISQYSEADHAHKGSSLQTMDRYVFPTTFTSGNGLSMTSPALSPKQLPETIAPNLLHGGNSQRLRAPESEPRKGACSGSLTSPSSAPALPSKPPPTTAKNLSIACQPSSQRQEPNISSQNAPTGQTSQHTAPDTSPWPPEGVKRDRTQPTSSTITDPTDVANLHHPSVPGSQIQGSGRDPPWPGPAKKPCLACVKKAIAQTVKTPAMLTSGLGRHAAVTGQPLYNGSGIFLVSAANGQLTAVPIANGNGNVSTLSRPLTATRPTTQRIFQNAQGQPILMPAPQADVPGTLNGGPVKTSKVPASVLGKRPAPDTSGKHIIVDIAETAVETFPYAKVAKRHNQTIEKVRNVFEAIVAVPLLRVPNDKRRAARLGQDRVKAYNAAKKEPEKQNGTYGNTAGGQEGLTSLFEISRSMGPSESLPEWPHGFPGPW